MVPLLVRLPNEIPEPTEMPDSPPATDPESEIVISVLEVALTGPVCAELMVCAFAINGATAASDAATAPLRGEYGEISCTYGYFVIDLSVSGKTP